MALPEEEELLEEEGLLEEGGLLEEEGLMEVALPQAALLEEEGLLEVALPEDDGLLLQQGHLQRLHVIAILGHSTPLLEQYWHL